MSRGAEAMSVIMRSPEFWRTLVPTAPVATTSRQPFTLEALEGVRASLRQQGYFQLDPVFRTDELEPIREAVDAVRRAGLPALFVFAYDAPWLLYASLSQLLRSILGVDYRSLAAFWAWYLDPTSEDAGWPRHRDRAFRTVSPAGDPEVVTVWVSVTDATPDNGCIRVVPRDHDDHYEGDLARLSFRPEDARDLPAQAGSVLGWTQQLIHWGGRASRSAQGARISLSAEFQSRTSDAFDEEVVACPPPLEQRLALIGRQLLKYRHMQSPSPALLDLAHALTRATPSP